MNSWNGTQFTERYKIFLSDGTHFMKALLSPKLNSMVKSQKVKKNTIVKLLKYDSHIIRGKLQVKYNGNGHILLQCGFRMLVVLNLDEIFHSSLILGSPALIEDVAEDKLAENMDLSGKMMTQIFQSTLSTDFLRIFNNSQFSDIQFLLRDGTICYAHKSILICRSSYFKSLLTNGMKESFQSEFQITDFEPTVFLVVLKFIYTDDVSFSPETDIQQIWDVIEAAKFFDLDRLDKLSQQCLAKEKLCLQSASQLWNESVPHSAVLVSDACKQFVEKNFEQIIQINAFFQLEKSLFLDLLSSPSLVVSNDILIEAILKWSKLQNETKGRMSTEEKQPLFCQFFLILRKRNQQTPQENGTNFSSEKSEFQLWAAKRNCSSEERQILEKSKKRKTLSSAISSTLLWKKQKAGE